MRLKDLRDRLDDVDDRLVKVLAERTELIRQVAELKKKNDLDVHYPKREEEILKRVAELAEKLEINPDMVKDIMKRVIEESHRIENDR